MGVVLISSRTYTALLFCMPFTSPLPRPSACQISYPSLLRTPSRGGGVKVSSIRRLGWGGVSSGEK